MGVEGIGVEGIGGIGVVAALLIQRSSQTDE